MSRILTSPAFLLRLEGAALASGAAAFYFLQGGSWLLFVALFLAPDVSMLGYLAGPRRGAAVYNLIHQEALPAALLAFGLLAGHPAAAFGALIWLAHIGMDRVLGYGLKYDTAFRDTHLSRV